jgi:alkylhydroperoxidase/carboxymuconolactone decarboxylase family protein YurZ
VPRFPYPDRKTFPQELQDFLAQVPEHLNFDMMSYSQSTIESFIRQGEAQYTGLELPHRSRELVILTTAAVTSAEYEFVQHVPISEAMGVDPRIREAIHKQDFDSALLSADDQAITKFVAAVVRSPTVDDDTFAAVRKVLSNREIVEVLRVVGFYVVRPRCDGPRSRDRTCARYRGHRDQREGRGRVATLPQVRLAFTVGREDRIV